MSSVYFCVCIEGWGWLKDQVHLSHHTTVRRAELVTLG